MDRTTSTDNTTVTVAMMTPFLHFTSGDALFFKAWTPSSAGALAGASIGLFFLAVFERWLAAMRGVLAIHWHKRALQMMSESTGPSQPSGNEGAPKGNESSSSLSRKGRARRAPAFIASHDLPRGAIFAVQALVGYLLMLAVMTFQAAYIICIIAGSGAGEMAFGRWGTGNGH
ncbi:hypothetical protein PUNSTDRAFT_79204 [Punctularia strigosozonata HHB-11173 SS5]|uniref:uncharacterized protein n=1 Tax=Punctularia strigosozonata (strain HHB-11173) TaxID=741275 RepID=UPI0004417967|nr:uncharacterized protein PUNSTDRAFT_79204 [Punctularia strigosozonata HHB-11173 SS5]EIN13571.1 hypothetical protein PUNSTDRAFT_79204 [Punctularia strigosozonata HHB-11173 SS5]